jgi:hypothetical protein
MPLAPPTQRITSPERSRKDALLTDLHELISSAEIPEGWQIEWALDYARSDVGARP